MARRRSGPALYLAAWQLGSTLPGEAAGVLLIAGACLTIAALLRSLASPCALAAGLALLALIDVVLVWGVGDMEQMVAVLHQVAPSGTVGDRAWAPALPAFDQVRLGAWAMGWLDLLAAALVGTVLPSSSSVRIAAGVSIFAAAWGLFHAVTPLVPATVPSLAGLAPIALHALRSPKEARSVVL